MQLPMDSACRSPAELAELAPLPSAAQSGIRSTGRFDLRLWLGPPVVLLLLAAAALAIDIPVAQWALGRNYPRAVRELMSLAEAWGHGVGVSIVLLTVYTLDPARRRDLPRAILTVAAAGCGANLVKLLIARTRPGATDLLHVHTWETFVGWLPFGRSGSGFQSFPSAHTATAVGLALVLGWLYPRGRWLFGVFAVAVGIQRVFASAHYPSDVLAGAAVGWLCAWAILRLRRSPASQSG
ncbi:MAG TPA: phosphatase PAP2 family protein [Pirellulales bacterium]|nr:phosphatase PAP2 family protein [Pirellulales bacterium]